MADPFSIIAGVLGITIAAIQSSKVFLELVNDIKRGPEEIESVSKDVHAFYAIVSSLNATLGEVGVKNAITCDDTLLKTIGNLAGPLENCQVVLGELMVKIKQQLPPFPEDKRFRKSTTRVRWCLFTKSEIRTLQRRLEARKATLCSALDAVTAHCSIRLLGKVATSQLVKWSSEPAEASSTIRRLVEDSPGHNSETQISRRAAQSSLFPERDTDIEEASTIPTRQILSRISSWVQETQHAFMSEDPSLRRHLAQIYRELGEQRMQISQLRLLTERPSEPSNGPITVSNYGMNLFGEPMDPKLDPVNAEDDGSTAVDMFFDCVSRFSEDNSSSTIDGLRAKFSGSPDYHFESNPSFYPEQYSTESLFNEKIYTVAMKASIEGYRTQQYFLLYAETPRRWRRIIISATFSDVQEKSAIFQLSDTDNSDDTCKMLPKELQTLFNTLLPRLELFSSVSSMSLLMREGESGQIVTESSTIGVREDLLEKEMSEEDQILQDIDAMGIRKLLESQITMRSRISSSCHRVWVDNRECVERKTPFASAGKQGENGFQEFFSDLKLLNILRGCAGVVQLIGVVLDDTRRHLKSYLYESPAIISLRRAITLANSKSETMPWRIREIWSSQIVKAVSDVHSRGVVVGALNMKSVGLRADGTAVLTLRTSYRHLQNKGGIMPPELRNDPRSNNAMQPTMMNFRTDIFQLGYILWLLAEHKPDVAGYLCAKSACTKFPRIMCDADHVNPVELPPCCGGIPPYFNEIIRECRSPDPRTRPTALKLAKDLTYTSKIPPEIIEVLDTYAPEADYFMPLCDECGVSTRNLRYHCNVCKRGSFDLCPACVERGVHCFVSEHRLLKWAFEKGEFVGGS